jgi:hypothetical protein
MVFLKSNAAGPRSEATRAFLKVFDDNAAGFAVKLWNTATTELPLPCRVLICNAVVKDPKREPSRFFDSCENTDMPPVVLKSNAAGPRSEATGASFSGLNVCQLCFFPMVFLKSNAAGPRSEATGASFSGLNVCCQLCFFQMVFLKSFAAGRTQQHPQQEPDERRKCAIWERI